MNAPVRFDLSKWYFDCVSEEAGQTFIGYAGEIRWKSLVLHYQSIMQHSDAEGTRSRFSLRRSPAPCVRGETLEWKSAALRAQGTWNAREPAIEATIWESAEGNVEWRCVQPRSTARVRIADAWEIAGLGYAEHLRVTIPPWQMPLAELRWGRFLSENDSLVWIDWRGPTSKQFVFWNGREAQAEAIGDERVVLKGQEAALELEERQVLREGLLGKTALSIIPNARKLFPVKILGVQECKWRSRATLKRRGNSVARGWAIHEVVRWP